MRYNEEIVDQKERQGILGFLMTVREAIKCQEAKIRDMNKNPSQYKLLMIGSPIWGGNITPAVRTYIQRYGNDLPSVAFFFSSGGRMPDSVFERLSGLVNKKPVAMIGISRGVLKNEQAYQAKLSALVEKIREYFKENK